MTELPPRDPGNPYPFYEAVRRAPGATRIEPFGAWAVGRYDDVQAVLRDNKTFSSTVLGGLFGARTVISVDPPDHTKMRSMVNRAFTPKMVADMEPRIRAITAGLLEEVRGRDELDIISDFAVPVPVIVIAELLGVDPARRDDFKRWSDSLIFSRGASFDPREREQMERDMQEFRDYFAGVIAARRSEPREDLISMLVRAEHEESLSPDEVMAFTMLLLIAGNETTTNLIGNGMLALLENPSQLALVEDDPALIPNMVEEALRYDSPVQAIVRMATSETTIGETTIPMGSVVMPLFASANRDEAKFAAGDCFDITRANAKEHVAFGYGIHFCLGAPLARLEARVVFEELFARFGGFSFDPGKVQRLYSPILRGLKSLPVGVEAR